MKNTFWHRNKYTIIFVGLQIGCFVGFFWITNWWGLGEVEEPETPAIVGEKVLKDLSMGENCSITRNSERHVLRENGGVYALNIHCKPYGKSMKVFSPLHKNVYLVQQVGANDILGDFIVLRHGNMRYVFGHTKSNKPQGALVQPGEHIGDTTLTGVTTGWHLHYDIWMDKMNVSPGITVGEDYKINQKYSKTILEDQRKWDWDTPKARYIPPVYYYFTSYNLTVAQTDADPCSPARPRFNLCEYVASGGQSMAIALDVRKKFGIKWGDMVVLKGDAGCAGTFMVNDEMGERFRKGCIYRPGTKICIKGDVVNRPGGKCYISYVF